MNRRLIRILSLILFAVLLLQPVVPVWATDDNLQPLDVGVMQTGWLQDGDSWYYYNSDGTMRTGWLQDGGSWYYLQSDGKMATGWLLDGNNWYYLKSGGNMATGWQWVSGCWYYLKTNGAMQTGWLQDGGSWYYLKPSGKMATGWQKVSGSWYYLKANGAMKTGWLQLGNAWYYLSSSGAMVTGCITINDVQHRFSSDGVWRGSGNGKIICIDPGHQKYVDNNKEPVGPNSSTTKIKSSQGTAGVSTKVAEYILNLEVSLQLRDELEQRGYTVVMTRTTHDVNISNVERAQIANSCGADAFLRIHANGSTNRSANGTETLCQTASNRWNGFLYKQSYALSLSVVNNICALTGSKNRGVTCSDSYTGINWAQVPVSIVEMGFMSNATEDRLMQTAAYQQRIVQGIANGLDEYFGFSD